ncbi:MAG: hypothetical protein ACOXZ9_02610 [Bacteroidales bacterium]|jgi:hypothetical protein
MKRLNIFNFRLSMLFYLSLCINLRYFTSLFGYKEVRLFLANMLWDSRSWVLFLATMIPLLILSIVGSIWAWKIAKENWRNFNGNLSKIIFVIWAILTIALPFYVSDSFFIFFTAMKHSVIYLLVSWAMSSFVLRKNTHDNG